MLPRRIGLQLIQRPPRALTRNARHLGTVCLSLFSPHLHITHSSHFPRLEKITLFGGEDLDGHVVQSTTSTSPTAPSDILSVYIGKPVHLVYKGPGNRWVEKTPAFPELKATSVFQDMYPLLLVSEESVADVERETRKRVGEIGVEERWAEERMQARR